MDLMDLHASDLERAGSAPKGPVDYAKALVWGFIAWF